MIGLDAELNIVEPDEMGNYPDGTTLVNASFVGGSLLLMTRNTDRDAFRANAIAVGILVEQEDDEGNPIYRVASTVSVTEEQPDPADPRSAPMPRIMLTPGEYDEEGNQTVAPTFDSRYHANIKIGPTAVAAGAWKTFAVTWTQNGAVEPPNKTESAIVYNGTALIDPASIASPSNVFM